jgi:superfamily II DNA or RNA helicase
MNVLREVLQVPIGQFGDGVVDPQRITVATIQTTARAENLKFSKESPDDVPVWRDDASEELTQTDRERIVETLQKCQVAIFDECHHLPADTFYQIAMNLKNAYYRYGLSATPWRSDRSDLLIEAALGPKLCVVTSSDLIKKGFLVPPKITMYEVLPTQKKIPNKYPTVYKSELVEHIERNRLIADVAGHLSGQGKTVLILVSQINHGQNLEGMIPGSTFIHGQNSSDVRQVALERLRDRSNHVLIATTLADEGLDLPSLDALILAGGGRSETRALQRIGRVLRPHPGKKSAIVVDFYDQTKYLEEHSKHRFEIYQTEPAFEVEIRPPRDRGPVQSRQKILAEN